MTADIYDFPEDSGGVAYTFCDACNQIPFCGVKVRISGGRAVGIEGWEGFPNGPPCAKAYATLQEEYHPDRLLHPMIRTSPKGSSDPGWRRATWDEVLDLIARRLREVADKYGPESVLFYAGNPKEMRLPLARLASAFGSPNFGTEDSLCYKLHVLASQLLFGVVVPAYTSLEGSRSVLLWGANPAASRPYILPRLLRLKARGTKFVVVDPRRTPTAERLADVHLRPLPGTDGALALGMINVLIRRGYYDGDFVDRWVHGFDELRRYASKFTPERVEEITRVPAREVERAAILYATNRPGTLFLGIASPQQSTNGTQSYRAILALAALAGNLDVPGGLVIPTRTPLPYNSVGDEILRPADALRVDFALLGLRLMLRDRRADIEKVPVWAELIPNEIQVNFLPEYVREGRIRAALLFGINVAAWPDRAAYQEALDALEFSAAVDYFYRPWTHDHVDVVLPAATMYEREEPFAVLPSGGGWRIYRRQRALEPRGEARSDWWIAFQIAVRLGLGDYFWNGDTRAAMDWILRRAVGVGYEEVPVPEGLLIPSSEEYRKYERGLLRDDGRPGFPTPTGKVEVWSTILEKHGYDPLPVYVEPPFSPNSEYPLILMTALRDPYYTTGKHRWESGWVRALRPYPTVDVNPRDAEPRGISEGDAVLVVTPRGNLRARAHLTYSMLSGVVGYYPGWSDDPGTDVNSVLPRLFDPISGYPSYTYICDVRREGG